MQTPDRKGDAQRNAEFFAQMDEQIQNIIAHKTGDRTFIQVAATLLQPPHVAMLLPRAFGHWRGVLKHKENGSWVTITDHESLRVDRKTAKVNGIQGSVKDFDIEFPQAA